MIKFKIRNIALHTKEVPERESSVAKMNNRHCIKVTEHYIHYKKIKKKNM